MVWLRMSRVARLYGQGLPDVAEWPIDAFRWAETIDKWEHFEAEQRAKWEKDQRGSRR